MANDSTAIVYDWCLLFVMKSVTFDVINDNEKSSNKKGEEKKN
jgi:hypothetical protein